MNLINRLFGNTLYYSGCMYKYVLRDENERYKEILKKSGVDFIIAPDEFCCGSPVLKAGYKKDFENVREQNLKIFKSLSVKEIITACPACRLILKVQYGLKVRHITEVLYDNRRDAINRVSTGAPPRRTTPNPLPEMLPARSCYSVARPHRYAKRFGQAGGRITLQAGSSQRRGTFPDGGEIYYHDPCHLGRLGGIYDQPRNILKSCGYEVLEFNKNRNQSQCCGAGGGVKANFPALAGKIASNALSELLKDAIIRKNPIDSRIAVTSPCPMCFAHFKEIAKSDKDSKIKIIEFSQLL